MDFKRILVTGGAGFVGSNLAIRLRESFSGAAVTALDNLARRGSELALPRLRAAGVTFAHGDVRCPEDLERVGPFDLLLDCSAEPSVQAGATGSPTYVLETNLAGTIRCAEAARRRGAAFLFLSTSRVYPMGAINALPFVETADRFDWGEDARGPGLTAQGIAESFPLDGPRSYYGASKLAAELVLAEFRHTHGLPVLIDRCGVLAGPWQMGKVDQGVVTLWVARHAFERPLDYIGFGGTGKQVRDVLHVDDLFDLLLVQMKDESAWDATPYNVGGGRDVSVSLRELTALCREATGRTIPIGAVPATSDLDVRIYLSDATRARERFGWRPTRSRETIVADIARWITDHRDVVRPIFAG